MIPGDLGARAWEVKAQIGPKMDANSLMQCGPMVDAMMCHWLVEQEILWTDALTADEYRLEFTCMFQKRLATFIDDTP